MDRKISELDEALQINNDAVFPFSQENSGEDTTFKASITQIGAEIGEDQTFSNLDTTDKTLVGAINEIAQGGGGGGSSTLAGLTDVDIDDQTLSNGQVLKYNSVEENWKNDDVGAGGHTIVDNEGTDLAQRTNLQFLGAYSEDNSTDDTTKIHIVRSMTKAEFNQLSAAEKLGLINTTDEEGQITADNLPISSSDPTNTKEYIDNGLSGKIQIATFAFTKSINATTEATFFVTRTDFNLPTGAKVIDGYIKQSSYISTNNTWAYACNVNQTGTNALQGAIYNPTNADRNYTVMATVFYTL